MTLTLIVDLAGTPRALPRGRSVPGRRRPVSLTGKAKVYAQVLQRAAQDAVSNVGPDVVQQAFAGHALRVDVLWQFPTRRSEHWGQLHTHKPDTDNLLKMVLDCLQRAGALGGDDSRVATGTPTKRWAERGSVSILVQAVLNTTRTDPDTSAALTLTKAPNWLLG